MHATIRIPDARLDYFMAEDIPYLDLTTEVLGIGNLPGVMEYFTREACIVAGVSEVRRIAEREGCAVEQLRVSGDALDAGDTILCMQGNARALHAVWKVGLNLLDHLSAIATQTRASVDAVHAVNPACEILTTRKTMPGAKDLLTEAVMVGGAFPHRLGLSETILVFEKHMAFFGGFDEFVTHIPEIRNRCIEKKLFVEATAEQAPILARAGVDGIQLDKISVEALTALVAELRAIDPHLTIIAAGGINPDNAVAYAATGVNGLATTAFYTAKPLDMSVRMRAL